MTSPHPAALAAGGVAIALGLAAFVAFSPQPVPRLVATPIESHDHNHYYAPINTPYATAVDLCLDRPGKAQIVDATMPQGAPKLQQFGQALNEATIITAECPAPGSEEGEHGAAGQRVRLVLEGQSPEGARNTVVRIAYKVDGSDEVQQTDAVLPALHQRPS